VCLVDAWTSAQEINIVQFTMSASAVSAGEVADSQKDVLTLRHAYPVSAMRNARQVT